MIERAFVKTAMGRMHYREFGAGPAILMLHSTPDASTVYEGIMPALGEKYCCLALDTPGYGDSDAPPQGYDMAGYAAAAAGFLDALKIRKAAVIGTHTGSSIAVELAAGHPEKVASLIMVGVPFYPPGEAPIRRAKQVVPFIHKEDGSHLLQAWAKVYRLGSTGSLEAATVRAVNMLKAPKPFQAYEAVFDYDMAPRLALIKCPTLIMAGANDSLAGFSKPAAELIPGARTIDRPVALNSSDFTNLAIQFLGHQGAW